MASVLWSVRTLNQLSDYSRLLAWHATLTTLKFLHIDSHPIARNSGIDSQTPGKCIAFCDANQLIFTTGIDCNAVNARASACVIWMAVISQHTISSSYKRPVLCVCVCCWRCATGNAWSLPITPTRHCNAVAATVSTGTHTRPP